MEFLNTKPYTMREEWRTHLDSAELTAVFTAAVEREGGRVDRKQDNGLTASFGSRPSFRFWGLLGHPKPEEAAPVIVDVHWGRAASETSSVTIEARSNEGWAIYRGRMLAAFYRDVLRQKIEALKAAVI
ncbi:hypothetical protein [Kribbella flavida]|uniref:hypothetical protein n=1 Tax=Kribbella flavida TaxID=182640 RepID=UPI0011D1C09F|nr:hypothetical protein [Kribbella flavida]